MLCFSILFLNSLKCNFGPFYFRLNEPRIFIPTYISLAPGGPRIFTSLPSASLVQAVTSHLLPGLLTEPPNLSASSYTCPAPTNHTGAKGSHGKARQWQECRLRKFKTTWIYLGPFTNTLCDPRLAASHLSALFSSPGKWAY